MAYKQRYTPSFTVHEKIFTIVLFSHSCHWKCQTLVFLHKDISWRIKKKTKMYMFWGIGFKQEQLNFPLRRWSYCNSADHRAGNFWSMQWSVVFPTIRGHQINKKNASLLEICLNQNKHKSAHIVENIGELCKHKADKSKATAGGCNKCVGMPKPAHMLTFTLNVILVTAK